MCWVKKQVFAPSGEHNDPVGVNTICAKSKCQNEVNDQPEGAFNTTSEYDLDVNGCMAPSKSSPNNPKNLSDPTTNPLMHEMAEWDPSLDRYWEVEEGMGQIEDVQGRLKYHLSFWEQKLEPAPWIISCIRDSYKLSLCSVPSQFCKPNQQSAMENHL